MPATNPLSRFSFKLVFKILLFVVIASSFFAGGYYYGASTNPKFAYPNAILDRTLPSRHEDLNFSLFWSVWDTLDEKYFDKSKLIPAKLVYGAISGMVAAVGDPYTAFIPPDQYKVVQEDLSGSFDGIGIQIGFRGTTLAVISPLPGSPAQKAGVRAGDLIVGIIDEEKGIDQSTAGTTLPEAVQLIRGKAGTTVTLVLLREESVDPIQISIVRENIDIESVTLDFVGDNANIAHLTLTKFSADTLAAWDATVIDLLKHGEVEGIILDLRNNPGGYLEASVDIANEFLDKGVVVVKEEYADKSVNEFKTTEMGNLRGKKLLVLVNAGSASASEILAGALRDQLDVQLVGETTFGKGTIQEPQTIEDGSGLHITIARWLTPDGIWVNEVGLEPDVVVADNLETPEDEQLLKAIEVISSL